MTLIERIRQCVDNMGSHRRSQPESKLLVEAFEELQRQEIAPEAPPWWREAPLTEAEAALLAETLAAHGRSALRSNASTVAALQAAGGSHSFVNGLAAALLTLGGAHGPLEKTHRLLADPSALAMAEKILSWGVKVPGWGNSFEKGHPDPGWAAVDALLRQSWPEIMATVDAITSLLQEAGKNVFPNPSAYTAATAIALGIPAAATPWLFVSGRLDAWAGLLVQALPA